jgi:glycosyltransferase involved in cell wall biosynthesis
MVEVSVVLPFNRLDQYLNVALDSILLSSLSDLEVLLVSDGIDILEAKKFLSSIDDPRVSVVLSKGKGIVAALNTGWEVSKGTFIARMDGDDICHTERLGLQLEFLKSHPNSIVVGSNLNLICEHGTHLGIRRFRALINRANLFKPFDSPTAHPSTMIRKSFSRQEGPYREFYAGFQAEDFDLWNRILRSGSLANLRRPLLSYRIHAGQVSTTKASAVALSTNVAVLVDIHESYSKTGKPVSVSTEPNKLLAELTDPNRVAELTILGKLRFHSYIGYRGAFRILTGLRDRLSSSSSQGHSEPILEAGKLNIFLSICLVPLVAFKHFGSAIRYLKRRNNPCPHCVG